MAGSPIAALLFRRVPNVFSHVANIAPLALCVFHG